MGRWEVGRPAALLVCGSLVYYHCAYRQSSLLSLVADVFIVLLCSLAILGMLFRQMNISDKLLKEPPSSRESPFELAVQLGEGSQNPFYDNDTWYQPLMERFREVPVDPLEWQISQDTANTIAACMANTIGAAESVLRVAATGHDKRLFLKVVFILYLLSALGRLASGATVAYIGWCYITGLFLWNIMFMPFLLVHFCTKLPIDEQVRFEKKRFCWWGPRHY